MPTLNQIRTKVDNWLANKWPTIVARQQNYFTNTGRYWQGLRSHAVCPAHTGGADTGDTAPDRLDDQPDDQGAFSAWSNVFPEWVSELLPACIWIDVYDSPQGKGWVGNVEVTYDGTVYRRSQNVGPESHRTQGWHQVPPVTPP